MIIRITLCCLFVGGALPGGVNWEPSGAYPKTNWDYNYAYIYWSGISTQNKMRNYIESANYYYVCQYTPGTLLLVLLFIASSTLMIIS